MSVFESRPVAEGGVAMAIPVSLISNERWRFPRIQSRLRLTRSSTVPRTENVGVCVMLVKLVESSVVEASASSSAAGGSSSS